MPALIIVRDKDTSTPVASAYALAEALITTNVHIIPDAFHFTNLEAPEAVNKLPIEFFK
jgi:pimeloyl-ACP methyl ester carboxylesterase